MSPGSSIITHKEESLPEVIPTSIASQSEASSERDNSQGNEIVFDVEVREGMLIGRSRKRRKAVLVMVGPEKNA